MRNAARSKLEICETEFNDDDDDDDDEDDEDTASTH